MTRILHIKNTKLVDQNGRPMPLFHATPFPGGISRYRPLSHFGTARAASMRAAGFVYEALGLPNPAPMPEVPDDEIILRAGNKLPTLSTQKLYLYMRHPLEMMDLINHSMAQWQYWFSRRYDLKRRYLSSVELSELDALGSSSMNYKRLVTQFIFMDPFTLSQGELMQELASENLYDPFDWQDDKRKVDYPAYLRPVAERARKVPFRLAERVVFQRMIRFLEGEGYDGFKYRNQYEDMGNFSFMNMRPESVFNALRDVDTHIVPALPPKQQAYLWQQEQRFFGEYDLLSPTDRIRESKKVGGNMPIPSNTGR